jgi:transcription initiation factor IIE alpha subunit
MNEKTAIATLIHWKDGVDKERIERWLKKLQEQGHIQSQTTNEYNPNHGEPVWYIP